MKSTLQCFAIIGFAIIAAACNKTESPAPEPKKQTYQITATENGVLNAMLDEETEAFATGNDSVLGLSIDHVTAKQIAIDYNKNEVGADAKYKNKSIFVTATITGIQSDFKDEPFLTLNGANLFQSPQARFKKNDIGRISKLEKGQKINLVCTIKGEIVGTPMLSDCVFSDEYANERKNVMLTKYQNALAGNREFIEPVESQIFLFSIFSARQLGEDSQCKHGEQKKCIKEVQMAIGKAKEDKIKQDLLLLAKEFDKYGFTLPAKKH